MPYSMGDAIAYIKLNIKNFEENYKKVHDDTEQLETIADGLGSVFDKAAKLVVAAFTAISAAAAGALKSTIDVGSSFEASMSQVAATMGMTADEIANNSEQYRRLADAAKEAGASTRFTADEAAQGLQFLALAGYSVDEAISTLPTILDLAAAGGMDLARASDMVTDAMSALSLPLEEATSFTDKLARTAQRSNTSVAQLGEAILQIGGTAKSLAGGVDELDTALGILANNGIKAAEGGTALRQIILNLTAPSEKAAKYMESIGFSAYDAAGNMKPLNETFAELSDIVNSANTQLEKDEIITNIFDARQLKSARALLAGYGDSWNDLFNEIQNADGAASQMAQTMQENLQGAMTIAKSAIEGVQVTAYEALENGLTKSVKSATNSISQLNKTLRTPEMQQALEKIGGMFGDVLTKFADFAANTAIPKLIEWFSHLDELADNLKAVLAGLATAIGVVGTVLIALNGGLKEFVKNVVVAKSKTLTFITGIATANPVLTAIAAAFGLIVGAIVSYESHVQRVTDTAKDQETALSKTAQAARDTATALEEYRQKAAEIADSQTEQINELRRTVNALGEYANKTHLTADELAVAQTIIEKLNELYPENTAYIEDGQVVGYRDLALSVQEYTDQLYYARQLEASQEKYFSAKEIIDETTKALEENKGAIEETEKQMKYWQKAYKLVFSGENYSGFNVNEIDEAWKIIRNGAKEADQSIKDFVTAQKALSEEEYNRAVESEKTNKTSLEQAQKDVEEYEQNVLLLRHKAGDETVEIYDSQTDAMIAAMKKQGEEYQKRVEEEHKDEIDAANKAAADQEKAYADMWDNIAELDRKWKLKQIDSEEEYQRQRKELLETAPDEYDDKWVQEYSKSLDYQQQVNEKAREQAEQNAKELQDIRETEIRNQIKALEDRAKIDEQYTQEMLIADKESIISSLDKTSELYKKFNEELKDDKIQLKIDLANKNKQIAENEFQTWTDSYNTLVTEAENAYKEIQNNQNVLMNSLTSNIKLYDTESQKVWDKQSKAYKTEEVMKVNAQAIKEQADETEKYISSLEKLQDKIPDSLMAEIYEMDREEGQKYADQLNEMSEKELKSYVDNYNRIYEVSKEFTDKLYSDQLNNFKEEYANKFDDIFKDIPQNMNLVGRDSIDGFIQGIQEKSASATGALQDLFAGENGVLEKTKEILDIHSPSGKFEEIGVNSIDGFIKGVKSKIEMVVDIFKSLGQSAGESFTNSFQSVWDNFAANFKSGLSNMSFVSQFVPVGGQQIPQNYLGTAFSGYNQQQPQNVSYQNNYNNGTKITKQDIVSAIKQAMPDGNVILNVDGQQFGLIARKELNIIASQSGNLNLKN